MHVKNIPGKVVLVNPASSRIVFLFLKVLFLIGFLLLKDLGALFG